MNVGAYLRILRDSWQWVAFFTLAGVLVAMTISLLTPQKYAATAQLFLATPGFSSVGSLATEETSPYQADQFSQNRARTYTHLAGQTELARRVLDKVGIDMSARELADSTEARIEPDTVLIDVTVKGRSGAQAKTLADAVAAELGNEIRILETPSGSLIPTVDPVVTQLAEEPDGPSEPNVWIYLVFGISAGFLLAATVVTVASSRISSGKG